MGQQHRPRGNSESGLAMIKIKIYTSSYSPYSKQLKKFLYEQEIPFDEVEVERGERAVNELKKLSGDIVTPVIVIHSMSEQKILVGWSQDTKSKLLAMVKNFDTKDGP